VIGPFPTNHASVWNKDQNCSYEVGLKVFKIMNGNQNDQVLSDSDITTLQPGNPGPTQNLQVSLPTCQYQIDLILFPNEPWTSAKQIRGWIQWDAPQCTNTPPPTAPICSPSTQTVDVGQNANFNATGGNGSFTWTGGGNPSTGSGSSFHTSYSSSGTKTVTVTSNGLTDQCIVIVQTPNEPPVYCSPATQTINVGGTAHFAATGGNGSFTWTGGGVPSTGSGSSFDTSYLTVGTKTVTVRSGTRTAQCVTVVQTPPDSPVYCSPATQTINVGGTAHFAATGGNGSFTWTGGGSPSTGSGSSFNTTYSSAGTKTVTVRSGTRTAQCQAIVQPVVHEAPSCSPSTQNAIVGQTVNFSATGGNGSFSWSAPNGNPVTGSGSAFHTSYSTAGTRTVTVTSNGLTDQCIVVVTPIVTDDISCTPTNQTVNVDESASFTATGGDGAFHWTASGGSPSTGSGSSFNTSYSSSGAKHVLVNDNSGHTAQCNVQVNPIIVGAPVCNPSSQNVNVDEIANFTATGGNGSFHWSASGGSPSSGNGSSFQTEYGYQGTYTVTVTSNGLSDQCIVHVDEENEDDLTCSPGNQDVDIDEWVTFRASGGSGDYRWTADDGDPDSDTGRTFTTRFEDDGRYTVRVRDDNGNSATCRVDVEDDHNSDRPSCRPSSQTANVNEQIEFFANDGTGDYEWEARDGSPRYGYGSRFTTSFDEPGTYEVELDSNGETDTCEVEIRETNNGAPFCSPSLQNANVNDYVTFSASGGNGSYSWNSSFNSSPATGSGSSFGARFLTPGTKFVTVTSNGLTSQCAILIGSVLGASTIVTGPTETAAAAAGLGLLGAIGAYGAVYRERSKKFISKLTRLIRR
jgi:hypothetical protein